MMIGGCTSLEWHKSDATADARDHDLTECTEGARSEARQLVPMLYPPGPRTIVDNQRRAVPVDTSRYDNERFQVAQDLMRSCMRERGYVLQPRERDAP